MKRILAAVMTCLILASMLNIGAFAFSSEVGNVDVYKLGCDDVITVDGNIDAENEFWSNTTATNLNDNNTATAWNYRARVITDTDIRFAYSNEGLYVAAKTNDDTPIRSTGHEMHPITGEDDNEVNVGWNGDTLILAFDPLQTMTYSYTEWADYSQKCPAWYCFTLMDDGTTGIWRGKAYKLDDNDEPIYNETGDISDIVNAVATSTVDGQWNLEVFIPWTELAYTLGLITDGNYVIDAEEFAKSGAIHNAKFIYMNRYAYDQKDGTGYSGMFLGSPDTGTIVTICRNFTVSNMIPGTSYQGIQGNPEQARTSGMYLNLVDNTDDDALHTPAAEPEVIESNCTTQGKSTIYCTKCHEILSREYLPLDAHEYYVADASTGKQKCSVCDGTAGAVVNGTDPYDTFSAAYAAANAGDSIKIFASETMFSTLALDKAVTIDLGGKTIKSENGPVFEISADVVFNNSTGTGKVTGNGVDIPVKIVGGTTTVNKGRFSGDGIAVFDVEAGANLVINGGQVRSVAEGLTSHFAGEGSIVVYGGTFRGADPSAYLAACLIATGVYDEADNYTEYSITAEHNVGEIEEKAPTCTEDGYRKSSCLDCGRPAVDEVIPALGHTAGDLEEVLPTCTEDGYRKAICTVCGEAAIDEIVPALGHTAGEEQTVEMTCTVDGAVYTICTVCGETVSYDVVSPAPGHLYKLTAVDPTCDEEGTHSFVCHCGDTHTYTIPALGHTCGDWTVVVEPACDAPGTQERTCSVCGEVETEEIAPIAHTEVYVEAKDATCYEEGNIEYYYCSVCGAHWTPDGMPTNAKNVIIPVAHDIIHVDAIEPACHYDGNIEYEYCSVCDTHWTMDGMLTNRKRVIIPALGGEVIYFERVEPTCHYDGNIEYWFCPECEKYWVDSAFTQITNRLSVILPALGGEVEHVEAKDPTCLELGNVEYWHCEQCDQYWLDEALTMITNRLSVLIGTLEHNVIHVEAIAPACHYEGNIEYEYCSECGTHWTMDGMLTNYKSVILPRLSDEADHVEAKAPSCLEEGNVEYWHCDECDQYWMDEALTIVVPRMRVLIPVLEHTIDEVPAIEPACHYTGNIAYKYCTVCDTHWTMDGML
ncbi:MAG: hypothetical protein IJC50_04085, partial [Clostridia bacterium]|nr:hypothetical protein [Clostridia bacterium]